MKTVLFAGHQIKEAATLLKKGGLVVFPTETVYGLGASAFNPVACARIFSAKGRASDNPLIVHIASREQLFDVVSEVSAQAGLLIEAFWPGPLSLILPKKAELPDIVTAGLPTVGVRWPRDPVAAEFLKECGVPVAAPSANVSGLPSPTTIEMAKSAMLGRVDGILQGQEAEVGLESTIVGFPGGHPKIYRPGSVTAEQIAEVLQVSAESLILPIQTEGRPISPGMRYAHYKPEAEVRLFSDASELENWGTDDQKVGVMAVGTRFSVPEAWEGRFFTDWPEYAKKLYSTFYELDQRGCTLILCQLPQDEGLGRALRNRLGKASGSI